MGKTIIWSFQAFNDGQVHHSKFGRQVTTHLVFVFINFVPSFFWDILYFLQLCPCFLYSSVFLLSVFVHICCIFCYPLLLVICICDPPTWRGGGEKVVLTEKVKSSLFVFTFSLKWFSLSWKLKSWRKAWNAKPKYNYCVFF